MAAYIVFTRESTRDAAELDTYMQKVGPTLAGHPIKVLAAYGRQEVLEGPEVEGVVLLEFPSFEEAKAWYNSPAYREVREHRFRGSEYRGVIVEGPDAPIVADVAGNMGPARELEVLPSRD